MTLNIPRHFGGFSGVEAKKHNVILRAAPEESVFITKYTPKPPSFFQKNRIIKINKRGNF